MKKILIATSTLLLASALADHIDVVSTPDNVTKRYENRIEVITIPSPLLNFIDKPIIFE